MTLVGASTAPHTDIEIESERAMPLQEFLHPLEYDLLPILRKLPVRISGLPFPLVGQAKVFLVLERSTMAIRPFLERHRRICPVSRRRFVVDLEQLFPS
jgi:hypothetical protein